MIDWIIDNADRVKSLTILHLTIAASATLIGLILAVLAGSVAAHRPRLKSLTLPVSGVLYTIPSLTLFIFIPIILGTKILDPMNIVVALTIYTFSMLYGGVIEALLSVPDETLQAAEAMGYSKIRCLIGVELPMAIPIIGANLRVAAVSNVSLVSIGALIGVGGLGDLFTDGFQRNYLIPIFWGIILSVSLAIAIDFILVFIERILTPWVKAGEQR
ncbi:ABC transporter permease [Rhodococcus sp. NPDC055024]